MKHLSLCLVVVASTLATTSLFAQPVSSNSAVTVAGSTITSGGYGTYDSTTGEYVLSTGSDLILGATAIAEDHGTTATNTYNVGWTGGDANGLANLTDGNYGGEVMYNGHAGTATGGGSDSGAVITRPTRSAAALSVIS